MRPTIQEQFRRLPKNEFPLFSLPFFRRACSLEVEEEYILLAAVLYQEWTWAELDSFLSKILSTKVRFWQLPIIYQEEVQNSMDKAEIPKGYQFNKKVPGILWGVGEFIRLNPTWRESLVDFESAKALSRHIFYFGARSELKPKVRRLLIVLKLYFNQCVDNIEMMAFPLSPASISFFKESKESDYFFSLDTWGKMKYYNLQCTRLQPENPLKAYSIIEAYLT